ncbi:MAG: ribosomal-processing cysteine protease Prp [Lachnospiraceae bacterium]
MITVKIFQDPAGNPEGYEFRGHAEYAEEGSDIVCAAVSVLAMNTANAIEKLTDDHIAGESAEDGGYVKLEFPEGAGKDSQLLMRAMVIGLRDIQKTYGSRYIQIRTEEVRTCSS